MDIGSFVAKHWGDLASVLGLGFTIWALINAKRAANAAEEARDKIAILDSLADVSAAVSIMEEIKRWQRIGAWHFTLDRYSALRRHLVRVEQLSSKITPAQRKQIVRAIGQISSAESSIEESLIPGSADLNIADLNRVVSEQIDRMERVMIAIKQAGN